MKKDEFLRLGHTPERVRKAIKKIGCHVLGIDPSEAGNHIEDCVLLEDKVQYIGVLNGERPVAIIPYLLLSIELDDKLLVKHIEIRREYGYRIETGEAYFLESLDTETGVATVKVKRDFLGESWFTYRITRYEGILRNFSEGIFLYKKN